MTTTRRRNVRTTTAPRTTSELVQNPPSGELTRDQLAKLTDATVDFINRVVREAGMRHDFIADRLFIDLFDGNVKAALDPERNASQRYRAVQDRAGKSLLLDAPSLSRHVRIGALNQTIREPAWQNLPFSTKIELLPLLGAELDVARLRKGIAQANRLNVGIRAVREWVHENGPETQTGRPRGLTFSTGSRVMSTGVKLGDAEARKKFVAQVKRLGAAKQREFVSDLEATIVNLRRLQKELASDDG